MGSVGTLYVAVGNHATRNWQDLGAPRPPAGTDVKITFSLHGYKSEQIGAALKKLGVASYTVTGVFQCEVVLARQDVFALKRGPIDSELTNKLRDKLQELLDKS